MSSQDREGQMTLLDSVNAGIEFAIPVAHRMGVRIVELGAGHAVGTAPLEGNTNHLGTLYAGTLFGVAEILGGVISIATFDSSRFYPTVKDVQIRFRRPATTPVRATASLDPDEITRISTEAEANGKSEFVLDAQISDESGATVATTRGIYQLRKHGS
jgi:thioesterase domain-containing protein